MIGERENFDSQTQYGSLVMRPYDIEGNEISAFYDSSDKLVFVLDNTISSRKPNVLLVINPDADKKWDEILSGDYGIDLETIRPKQDNKYQKFDIEYSGLGVYDSLIKAYDAGDSLEESLNQLMILRDSAARHSAMTRLNMANEVIAKTNATIVKTKESIVRLQARLKTLRAKLAESKKGIGREPTKQSASKILKLESQIEATNEKLKRANERLKSAQKRLETATVDAELASQLLNQPAGEVKQVAKKQVIPTVVPVKQKSVTKKKQAEPEYDEYEEEYQEDVDMKNDANNVVKQEEVEEKTEQIEEDYSDEETEKVEPLFDEDPQILNNDIAFKPISFEPPAVPEISKSDNVPVVNQDVVVTEETTETSTQEEKEDNNTDYKTNQDQQSVLESMKPIPFDEDLKPVPVVDLSEPEEVVKEEIIEEKPETKTEETDKKEPLELEVVKEDVRQYEPEVVERPTDTEEKNIYDEYPVVPPVAPVAPVIPQSPLNTSVVDDVEPKRSKFFYYLLLILLIVLAVFTLWLYQKNVKPSVPVLAASVEKTELPKEQNTVFKKGSGSSKTSKNIKAPAVKEVKRGIDIATPSFLDEEPVVEPMPEPIIEEKPTVKETVEIVEPVDVAPQVMDAVPARVTTSGQPQEDKKTGLSEEEILSNKPEYQPGSKYDEMFVADEGGEIVSPMNVEYAEDDIVYMPQEQEMPEYVEENVQIQDPYFDEEEAAYQAEQAGLYYEE